MREFEWIARHFAPLAGPGALGLTDDAAVIPLPGGRDLVVTTDAMVADRHFLSTDPAALVARKLLRVNLSDLAAMGAEPSHVFLATAWPQDIAEDWIAGFADGLRKDLATFCVSMGGGDTVATPGPMTLSVTALGFVERGQALTRSGARPGETVYVSGTIGDGGLGLAVLQGRADGLTAEHGAFLAARYQVPEPRLALGRVLGGLASACLDISDGLAQDAGHIAGASGVAVTLELDAVPLSGAAQAAIAQGLWSREQAIAAGDDYELLFTLGPDQEADLRETAAAAGVPITPIGRVEAGPPGVTITDASGLPLVLSGSGFQHF